MTAIQHVLPHIAPQAPLHSLASLGAAAEAQGLNRTQVLAAATALYDAGLISYPRTDCGAFPEFIDHSVLAILTGLQLRYPKKVARVLAAGLVPLPRVEVRFEHHGIIPTGKTQELHGDLKTVYKLVRDKFLGALTAVR